MKHRQSFFILLLLLTSAYGGQHSPPVVHEGAPGRTWTKVPTIVLVAPQNDPRLPVARAVVDFWNRTFVEIGSPFKLGPVVHTTAEVSSDYLKMLSPQVLNRAGHADFPESIQKLPGDIIVV